jgi:glycosyltransferase involved in cell wall biosynthesis
MNRILFLANAASIHTVRWVNAISTSIEYEVHLFSLNPPSEKLHSSVSIRVAPLKTSLGYFLNVPFVRKAIREISPTITHAHYISGYGTLAFLSGFHPLILSVWGSDVFDFPRKSCIHRGLIRRNLRNADRILSTSKVMAIETSKYTDKQIDVTPFGIDLNQFRPKKGISLFNENDIVIGTVKTLDKKYGIEFLIRAFKLCRLKHSNLPLKLLIVGDGPQEAYLKQLSFELGISDDTIFTGHIKYDEIPRYHNMMTVSVFASVMDSESFGVSVVESSGCGKPVVVTNVGGLKEVVEDGVTGLMVEPFNAEETAKAIEKLILNKSLRNNMGEAGIRRVTKLYNWAENVNDMLRIYREVITRYNHSCPR